MDVVYPDPQTALAPELSAAPESAPQHLKLLTLNVWGLPGPLLVHPARMDHLARRINALDAHVVALQEVFSEKAVQALGGLSAFPYRAWGERPDGAGLGLVQGSGLLILSKFPILESATKRFTRATGTDRFARKGVLHARVELPGGQEVDLFNTHLNAGGAEVDPIRAHQAGEMADFITRRRGAGRPVVALGDFNFTPDCPAYGAFSRTTGLWDAHDRFLNALQSGRLPRHGFRPVALSREQWAGFSFDPDRNPYCKRFSPSTPTCRIDQVWCGSAPRARVQVAQTQLVFDQAEPAGRHLSDHFGVGVDLVLG
jgi:endonuclease/exonuclease/phosphatase family metal-dependent hydrolase